MGKDLHSMKVKKARGIDFGDGKKVVSDGGLRGKELEKYVVGAKKDRAMVEAGMMMPWVDELSEEEFKFMAGVDRDRGEDDKQGREIYILAALINGDKEVRLGGGSMGDKEVGAKYVNVAYAVRLRSKYPAFVEWMSAFQESAMSGSIKSIQGKMLRALEGKDFEEEKTYPLTLSLQSLTKTQNDMRTSHADMMAVRDDRDAEAMKKRVVDAISRDPAMRKTLLKELFRGANLSVAVEEKT